MFPSTFFSNPMRLFRDRCGSISVLFGVSVFVLFGAAGIGIDGIRAHRAAQRTAAALDSAALAAARAMNENDQLTDAQIIAIARDVFAGNTPAFARQGVAASQPAVTLNRATGSVHITTNLQVATTLSRAIGINSIPFQKSGNVTFASRKVELAMVLDVTGSMGDGGKLSAMKAAATDVINSLIDPNNANAARVALVPYSASVNVAPFHGVASGGDSLDGCVIERMSAGVRDTDEPPGFSAISPNNFAIKGQLNEPTNPRYLCPTASIEPLSHDFTALIGKINSFSPAGGTAGHIGISWGWNSLSPKWNGVFTGNGAPGPYGASNIIKAMLLMTDGQFNTSFSAGSSDAEQTAESVARAKALCDGMKAAPGNIKIYTVGFQTTPDAEALLRYCASSSADYYDANDSAQLLTAFRSVVKKLQEIRVTQ